MNNPDTTRLLEQCAAGDEFAIEQWIRQYETGVFRLALSVLQDEAEASEATQDTFVAALDALPTYQERSTFKAWLYTIAMNQSRSRLRKRRVFEKLKQGLQNLLRMQSHKNLPPEEQVIQNQKDAQIWNAVDRLGEKHRLPVILRYLHELSPAEIAEILHINEGTVHSRLHTARESLRLELEQSLGLSEKLP